MKPPKWSESKLPKPGEKNFSSIPGEQALAQDLDGRRRIMSGAGDLPFDVAADNWLIDQKETSRFSYTVKRKDLDLLESRALAEGRQAMVSIVFWSGHQRDEPWMLVRQSTLIALTNQTEKDEDGNSAS